MNNKGDYFYQKNSDGLIIIDVLSDDGTIFIPKEIDGVPVVGISFIDFKEYKDIDTLIISGSPQSFYLHSKTFSHLEKIVFDKDFDGTAEFVRDLVSLWAVKNIKCKTTLPEIIFKGKPSKFVVKMHWLLSNDEKKLIAALTRENFAVPKSVTTIGSKAILPTYKKTSVITYHPGITTIENNPFGLDKNHNSLIEFAIPQMNLVPQNIKNIGSGLIIDKNNLYVNRNVKTENALFVCDGSKLIIRCSADNVTDEALQEIADIKTLSEVVIESKKCPFEVKDYSLIYKKDILVHAIRSPNYKNPVIIPSYIKKSFVQGVRPQNKDENELKEESKSFANTKVEYVNATVDMFESKQFAWKGPDIKTPLSNMFRLKNPVAVDKLEIKLSDLKIPATRKKDPDYGFAIDDSCKYIKELVLPEGITELAIAKMLDGSSFALRKLVIPSTVTVTNLLPKLNQFKNLMLVVIKPEKKIQVKFGGLHYILANAKKKKYDSLFYTYSYNDVSDAEHESPYSSGSYGGITYISAFKQEKLLYHEHGYYYLIENEQGNFYRFLKTDFVETFNVPTDINGIKVKYFDNCCLSNVKNDPFANEIYNYGVSGLVAEGLAAHLMNNKDLEYMDE